MTDPLARFRRRIRRLAVPEPDPITERIPVPMPRKRNDPAPVETEYDDDGTADPTPTDVRRAWVGDPEQEARAAAIRRVIRDGFTWPPHRDDEGTRHGKRRVSAEDVDEYAALCAKRAVRLELVTLRRRVEQWFATHRDTASDEDVAAWREFLVILDDRLAHSGAHEAGTV